MKDSKFSYTAVRIYNTDLIEELEKTFNRTETSFASNRSQFLVHLIELGLGSYKETLEGKRSMPNEKPFDLPTDIEDLRDLLDKYITYGKFFHRGMITKSSINSMRVMVEETLSGNEFFFGQYQRKTLKEAGILLNDDSKFLKEKKIREKLSELLAKLPKGKADYMRLEMRGLRPLVDEIGMTML